jgi:hypothetical protein
MNEPHRRSDALDAKLERQAVGGQYPARKTAFRPTVILHSKNGEMSCNRILAVEI